MSKLSNTIALLRLLQNGKKYSIKELSDKLEVSSRMIREYKKELEYAGIYIESIRGPYGGYYLNQNIRLPKQANKKIDISQKDKKHYNLINRAINNRYKCFIEYYSKEHNKITKRIIRPYELLILDDEWGVAVFCEVKKEIRHFYLSRINKLKVLDKKF